LPSGSAEDLQRVAVLPFRNSTDNASYGSVCGAAFRTLDLSLRSLRRYQVVSVPRNAPEYSDKAIRRWAREQGADIVLYGSIGSGAGGLIVANVSVFDWDKATVVLESPPVKLLDIFEAIDELVSKAADSITGTHIGFGAIEFRNSGQKGAYSVSIDGMDVGDNVESVSRWKQGSARVVVTQRQAQGTAKLFDGDVEVVEDGTARVEFKALAAEAEMPAAPAQDKDAPAAASVPAAAPAPAASPAKPTLSIVRLTGSVSISAASGGDLYLDGVAVGAIPAGSGGKLDSVDVGSRTLEMRYADGKAESKTVSVAAGKSAEVAFGYRLQTAKLLAWYKFDETEGDIASDSSGRKQDAKLFGGAWVPGKQGGALNLNGKDQYVQLPAGVIQGAKDLTISFWIRMKRFSSWARVFDFGYGDHGGYIMLAPYTDKNWMRLAITPGSWEGEQKVDAAMLQPMKWEHVAAVISGGKEMTLYVDGRKAGSLRVNVDPSAINFSQNYLGKSQSRGDPYLCGSLDDFRIYGAALGAEEIAALYAEAK
jgi:TolB-like protein